MQVFIRTSLKTGCFLVLVSFNSAELIFITLEGANFENFHILDITIVRLFFPLTKHILLYRVVLRWIFQYLTIPNFPIFHNSNTFVTSAKWRSRFGNGPSRTEFTSAVNNSPKRWNRPFSNKFFTSIMSNEYSSVKSFFNQFKLRELILRQPAKIRANCLNRFTWANQKSV